MRSIDLSKESQNGWLSFLLTSFLWPSLPCWVHSACILRRGLAGICVRYGEISCKHISWCTCHVWDHTFPDAYVMWRFYGYKKKKKTKKKKKGSYLAVFQLMRKVRGGEISCKHIFWCTCNVWVNRLVKRKSKWMTFIFTHELSLTLASVLGPFCMHFAAGSGRNMRKVRGNILQTHFLMHMSRVGSHISWCICNVALLWI